MKWLLHFNTASLRKYEPSVPCSVSLSNTYVIAKACSENIMGSTNLAYSKKVNLKVPIRLFFQGLLSFLCKEMLAKCMLLLYHHPLIFGTQSFILSLQHIKLCISLLRQSLYKHSVLPNVMKDPLLIVGVILRRWSVKTLILMSLRH